MAYLPAFTEVERAQAGRLLATQVASMMGRKLEEGDWSRVYCRAKNIPEAGWSNLQIDVNYQGLGLELKLLRVPKAKGRSIQSVCGTTLMHPSATRSIRIVDEDADVVMHSVLRQYADLIRKRTAYVKKAAPSVQPDMRTGWLIWEDSLTDFLYFEERMELPDPSRFTAKWKVTPKKGDRKESKSLWIYDKNTSKKRYSVTTSAGIKIQPYFDVPLRSDRNLYHFRAQSESVDERTVRLWVSAGTAHALKSKLGSLENETVSAAISKAVERASQHQETPELHDGQAVGIEISKEVHNKFSKAWEAVSDEHRVQLLLKAMERP